MITFASALVAYLIGSIPFALLISHLMKLPDPRSYGDGELSATNVIQSGRRIAGLGTLVGDMCKGGIAVSLASYLANHFTSAPLLSGDAYAEAVCAAALAAFIGHLFPIYLHFKGNNGVAVMFGVFIGMRPVVGMTFFTVWFLALLNLRRPSVATLIMAAAAPIITNIYYDQHSTYNATVIIFSVLLVWQLRKNIVRLLRGQEPKLGQR